MANKAYRFYMMIEGKHYHPFKPGMSRRLENVSTNRRKQFTAMHKSYVSKLLGGFNVLSAALQQATASFNDLMAAI